MLGQQIGYTVRLRLQVADGELGGTFTEVLIDIVCVLAGIWIRHTSSDSPAELAVLIRRTIAAAAASA